MSTMLRMQRYVKNERRIEKAHRSLLFGQVGCPRFKISNSITILVLGRGSRHLDLF